jgi:hypothetical protein
VWKLTLPIGLLLWYQSFMSKSTTVISQKKRGPAPTGKGVPIMTRLQDDLLVPLDKFIEGEADKPSRPEAIRRILRDWLIGNGYLKD